MYNANLKQQKGKQQIFKKEIDNSVAFKFN